MNTETKLGTNAAKVPWSTRHPRLLVLYISGAVIIGVLSFGMAIMGVMRSSGAYQGALLRARLSTAVSERLGNPIKAGLFVTGRIHLSGPSGGANLAIPISGPRGKATIYVQSTKALGEWQFERVVVQIESSGERIDLSERKRAQQGARANDHGCHAACYLMNFRMYPSNPNRQVARGAPATVVAHL